MIQFVAMPDTLLFGQLAERFSAKRSLYLALFLFILVTIDTYFMNKAWEFWLPEFVIAIILGGSQAVSRSFFSSLIPECQHPEFFGFYAISAKFASVLGPFVFTFIVYITGSARLSILALTFFFVTGMLILSRVKEEKQPAAARPTRWLIFHEN